MIGMRLTFSILLGLCLFGAAKGQYWIGPKVGYHYTIHNYQDEDYTDIYDISNTHSYEAGIAVTYEASDRYAVHGELFFEKQKNRVRSKEGFQVDSESTFNYLSFPILLRVSMGRSPVHWYLNGGPKLSYWLSGSGRIATEEFDETAPELLDSDGFLEYDLAFKGRNADGLSNQTFFVNDANRIQYSLTAGGGFYLDLANGARMMFDFRYNWGHSNMGFNLEPPRTSGQYLSFGSEIDLPDNGYSENYEFSMSSISFSIAYMFEYNTELKRKGSSTSSQSRNNKKSTRKKRKRSR
jgi:hypothetical protein